MRVSGAMTMRLGRSRSPMRSGVKRGWTDMTALLDKGSDDAPVFSAQGPNRFLSICVFIACFHCLSYVHSVGPAMWAVIIVAETSFRRGFNSILALVFNYATVA